MRSIGIVLFVVLIMAGCCKNRDELFVAAKAGDYQTLMALIQSRKDANLRDSRGTPLLNWAVISGNTNCVKYLIEAGAELESRDNTGVTAIVQAARCNNLPCAKILLEAGASSDAVDEMGKGLVHRGTAGNRRVEEAEDWLRFALEQGLDLNQTDVQGRTALDWANVHGNNEIEQLIKRMGGISGEEVRRRNGITP